MAEDPSEKPAWAKRKGWRSGVIDPFTAVWRAMRYSWLRAWTEATDHLVLDIAAILALGVAFNLDVDGGPPLARAARRAAPPLAHIPKWLAGFASAFVIVVLIYLILFVLVLLHTPFRDHRKLVWERDHYIEKVRTVHLRVKAREWMHDLEPELKHASDLVNNNVRISTMKLTPRQVELFDPGKRFDHFRKQLEPMITDLNRLGQPRLAAQLTLEDGRRPTYPGGYEALVRSIHRLLGDWSGGAEFPPFAEDADEEGLLLLMIPYR